MVDTSRRFYNIDTCIISTELTKEDESCLVNAGALFVSLSFCVLMKYVKLYVTYHPQYTTHDMTMNCLRLIFTFFSLKADKVRLDN